MCRDSPLNYPLNYSKGSIHYCVVFLLLFFFMLSYEVINIVNVMRNVSGKPDCDWRLGGG